MYSRACRRGYALISVKPVGDLGAGQGFGRSLWRGGRAFELSCCPGGRIFEPLFMPMTTNHFLGWEFQLSLTSHFCLLVGNFTASFWKTLVRSHLGYSTQVWAPQLKELIRKTEQI